MKVNSSKCKILNIKGDCEVYIGTERVDTIETQNNLGILINRKFSWSNHAKSRCEKAVRAFFSIKRNTSNSASTYTKLALYCDYIVPILTYGSQAVYLNKGDLKSKEAVQKKGVPWVLNYIPGQTYKQKLTKLKPFHSLFTRKCTTSSPGPLSSITSLT